MQLQMPDGRQFHYLDRGNGPELVLLHGWAMSSGLFAGLVDDLAQDFRLLIPDLKGHGCSEPGGSYMLPDFAADICFWLESLGVETCCLLGWSFGGQIALRLAADRPDVIERLVLVSSTPKFCRSSDWAHGLPEVQVRAMARQFRRSAATTLDQFVDLMFSGEEQGAERSAIVRRQLVLPEGQAGLQSLTTLQDGDIRQLLPTISVPTLVHHGRSDKIIPLAAGEYLAAGMPHAEAVFWDDVGHAPFITCPDKTRALWKEYLR